MEIQNINTISQSAKTTRQKSTDENQTDFQSCLDACNNKIQDKSTADVQISGNVCNIQTIPFMNITSPQKEMAEKVSSVLDLFEVYSQDLQNPNKTLKEIEPTLLNMKQAAERLHKENTLSGETGSSISQFINNLQVTASVEYFKFQRGDYL
ncbi:hypothetical protein MHK_010734 [Candidatus Magnetomorum sp. HK-1]|nr:hypothetical protein MHK_010734 [Candidatus Magnetomorum sp. HK-1]